MNWENNPVKITKRAEGWAIMDDKELTEKVAEKLRGSNYRMWMMVQNDLSYDEDWKAVLSWPTFGLMVEKAEEMGWIVHWEDDLFRFQHETPNGDIDKITSSFETKEHGYIKACAMAFLEIFEDETINR